MQRRHILSRRLQEPVLHNLLQGRACLRAPAYFCIAASSARRRGSSRLSRASPQELCARIGRVVGEDVNSHGALTRSLRVAMESLPLPPSACGGPGGLQLRPRSGQSNASGSSVSLQSAYALAYHGARANSLREQLTALSPLRMRLEDRGAKSHACASFFGGGNLGLRHARRSAPARARLRCAPEQTLQHDQPVSCLAHAKAQSGAAAPKCHAGPRSTIEAPFRASWNSHSMGPGSGPRERARGRAAAAPSCDRAGTSFLKELRLEHGTARPPSRPPRRGTPSLRRAPPAAQAFSQSAPRDWKPPALR